MNNLLTYDEFLSEKHGHKHHTDVDQEAFSAKHLINNAPVMELPDKGNYLSKKKLRKTKLLLRTAKEHIDKIK